VPTSALNSVGLKPDDCIRIVGLDRGNEAGLRRVYPQGGWLVEAHSVDVVREPDRARGRGNPNEDDK
jgi:hypothetical protein